MTTRVQDAALLAFLAESGRGQQFSPATSLVACAGPPELSVSSLLENLEFFGEPAPRRASMPVFGQELSGQPLNSEMAILDWVWGKSTGR